VKICVQAGTTHVDTIQMLFPSFHGIVAAPTIQAFYLLFVGGKCTVLAGEQFDLSKKIVEQAGYNGNYTVSLAQFSKEPIALVTRDGDSDWSDLVNWVLLGLLTAENEGIYHSAAQSVVDAPTAAVNGTPIMFYRAVAQVGNYGEMYRNNLATYVARAPVNMLNNGSSPLLYSIPFGETNVTGPEPLSGGTLEKILQRGYLLCGIGDAPFFVDFKSTIPQLSGFDVDFCRAISAAIFNGTDNTVFIPIEAAERFEVLASGKVDLLSRLTSVTYERDVDEPTTKMGYTFAQPNFYTGLQFGGVPQ
jgi:ABC-type amino acid transport substrate-binding protein